MNIQEILKLIFNPDIELPIIGNKLEIIEPKNMQKDGTVKKIIISGVTEKSFAVKLDIPPSNPSKKKWKSKSNSEQLIGIDESFRQQLTWLVNKNHERANKKCDFVIFFEGEKNTDRKKTHNKKYTCEIIIGEIKTTVSDKDKNIYENQLINSRLYINYIWSMIEEYHNSDIEAKIELVVLTKTNNRKKFTPKTTVGTNSNYLKSSVEPGIVEVSDTDEVSLADIRKAIDDANLTTHKKY